MLRFKLPWRSLFNRTRVFSNHTFPHSWETGAYSQYDSSVAILGNCKYLFTPILYRLSLFLIQLHPFTLVTPADFRHTRIPKKKTDKADYE